MPLRVGLVMISVATLIATSEGLGSASPQSRLEAFSRTANQSAQSGFRGNQAFCAQRPLWGSLAYQASSGRPSLRVNLRRLPKNALVGINWSNSAVRGYLIATVRTDGHGDSIPGSQHLLRPAESRGYKVVLTWPTNNDAVATMWPCR